MFRICLVSDVSVMEEEVLSVLSVRSVEINVER